ncbi:MAG: transcription-repair coupling factor [Kiritimatiellae bacterium]|nr:transcription-repair coupling factor [Kiritimatiellia bacterium]
MRERPPLKLLPNDQEALLRALAGGTCQFDPLPAAAQAYVAWCLRELAAAPVVWVTDTPHSLETLADDVAALAPEGRRWCVFRRREPADRMISMEARRRIEGERLRVVWECQRERPPDLIVTCIAALLQPTVAAEALGAFLELATGLAIPLESVRAVLAEGGYEWVAEVDGPGQAAGRGGILDVWPPAEPWPVRVEWQGERIESMRTFDPVRQRSIERVTAVTLGPAREAAGGALLMDHLPADAVLVWHDEPLLREHAEAHQRLEAATGSDFEDVRSRWGRHLVFAPQSSGGASWTLGVRALDPWTAREDTASDQVAAVRAERVKMWLARARRGGEVWLLLATEGSLARFRELYVEEAHWPAGVVLGVAPLSGGFELEDGSLTVVAEPDLFPRRGPTAARLAGGRRRTAAAVEGERLLDPGRMEPGELVVHVEHGIGRYLGITNVRVGGELQEVLAVEYAEGGRLYVPLNQAHLLSRYIGVGGRPPALHRLGSRRWARERGAAEKAIRDLAARLIETQALRQILPGHAVGPDTPWQAEFEAAFPYVETEDQARAIAEVKRDLEAPRPADRLICGDVGYGKTEVAMRAAFKVVMDGRQVAVLAPTTVLAQQHFDTFRERMAAFPVTIAMLSRFCALSQQRETLRRLREGTVDIVIGTHRLLQPDVMFRDLGLVIVDEEQRFGVEHKEALKRWRPTVDVIAMSATPIPRTLYMSLIGARDLSVIETPPQDRLPIETIIRPWDDALVREAILRELDRGGQVFFLHNRVATIAHRHETLRQLVPEARIGIAHGQMPERQLADVMRRFGEGALDVLLCTTIIESGLDMPRVNTILIERADRFGVADLYQLRGRVGRYRHQAYAYLLLPRHGRLLDTARQRIAALRRHSGLGAGFRLAMRDLEIRGAGNLLGAEQSGHIAAVGFDLYCQLLRRTIAQLRGEAPPPPATAQVQLEFIRYTPDPVFADAAAALPADYVEDESLRLQLYRRIAGALTEEEIDDLAEELRDRFGPLARPAARLLELTRLRLLASRAGFERVETDGDRLLLYREGEPWMPDGRAPRLRGETTEARIAEIVSLLRRLARDASSSAVGVADLRRLG